MIEVILAASLVANVLLLVWLVKSVQLLRDSLSWIDWLMERYLEEVNERVKLKWGNK